MSVGRTDRSAERPLRWEDLEDLLESLSKGEAEFDALSAREQEALRAYLGGEEGLQALLDEARRLPDTER